MEKSVPTAVSTSKVVADGAQAIPGDIAGQDGQSGLGHTIQIAALRQHTRSTTSSRRRCAENGADTVIGDENVGRGDPEKQQEEGLQSGSTSTWTMRLLKVLVRTVLQSKPYCRMAAA